MPLVGRRPFSFRLREAWITFLEGSIGLAFVFLPIAALGLALAGLLALGHLAGLPR